MSESTTIIPYTQTFVAKAGIYSYFSSKHLCIPQKCRTFADMKTLVNPDETPRAHAYRMWMNAPMPMVTFTKTLDVTHLRRLSCKRDIKFTALMAWCIGKAAGRVPEFFLLPVQGQLYRYDSLAINVIVKNARGGINSCDIAFSEDFRQFYADYRRLTRQAAQQCESSFMEDRMVIGTSALVATELDSVTNQYTDLFCNPMVIWSRYHRGFLKTTMAVSFQFHHVMMDGGPASLFLHYLQETVREVRV